MLEVDPGSGGCHWLGFATPRVCGHGLDRLTAEGPHVRIATCIERSHGMVLGLLLDLNRAVPGGERDGAVLLVSVGFLMPAVLGAALDFKRVSQPSSALKSFSVKRTCPRLAVEASARC